VPGWESRLYKGRVCYLNLHLASAEEANEYSTAMYKSAPRPIIPQERCDLSLALTGPVPMEARGNRAISWPPVGVLLILFFSILIDLSKDNSGLSTTSGLIISLIEENNNRV
ncbi:Hypothetical protein DHA2_151829, partial [Giardia duodenalis]